MSENYIQYLGGYSKENIDFSDIEKAILEIQQTDDEHGVFWVSVITDDENDIVTINSIKKSKSAPSIKQVQPNDNSELSKVTKEIKVYTEDDHLQTKNDTVKELYETFRDAILLLSADIEVQPKKWYIAFKGQKDIADIEIQKNKLKLWINAKKGTLEDGKGITRDVSNLGHAGNGDYEISISDTKYLEYIMSLIKQTL